MARTVSTTSLARRRYGRGLALAGRKDQKLGAIVIDHNDPAAWCLPGVRGPVVLTSAAISVLDYRQLEAVLAHERAHQKGRHHLLVAITGSVASAFRLRAFRTCHQHVARLVELLADAAAADASPRLAVAEAILALGAPVPAAALGAVSSLGAGGRDTAARVRRLLVAPPALRRPAALAGAPTIAAVIAVPVVLAAGPALLVIGRPCPAQASHTGPDPL